jgi:phosphomannomutase
MQPQTIKFGTAGWRAQIAEGFTAINVQKLTHAISSHVNDNPDYGFEGDEYRRHLSLRGLSAKNPLVIVGYDTRYMSEYFAKVAANTLAANAISVKLSKIAVPTPVVGWAVTDQRAVGGITITASTSPYTSNGIKWTPFWGGQAIPEVTADIEARLLNVTQTMIKNTPADFSYESPLVELCDFRAGYFKHMSGIIDVKQIKKSGLKVAVDSLYGSVTGYLRPFLEELGLEVHGLHENRDVMFGGHALYTGPEPLAELRKLVLAKKCNIGLACDCDGDRFGVMDADGTWVSPNEILALVLEHLVKNRGMKGRVCRSVVTSHLIDAVARAHKLEVRETPVGFKFIGELMRTGQYLLGGEESGGMALGSHIPDKDGILACLLLLEMLAYEKKPLSKLRQDFRKRYGNYVSVKLSVPVQANGFQPIEEKLLVKPPLDLGKFSVWRIDQTDGFKFILKDGSWLGMRPSGSEQVVRLYAESAEQDKLDILLEAGKKIVKGDF